MNKIEPREADWIVYEMDPIDFHWEHLQTVQEIAAKLVNPTVDDLLNDMPGISGETVVDFLSDLETALALARKKYWEGDFRPNYTPRVLWLPDPRRNKFRYAFAWKQDNNGTTFIVAPFVLPWLENVE